MKLIISIICYIALSLPALASNEPPCHTNDTNVCTSLAGCGWDSELAETCVQCTDTEYSTSTSLVCMPCSNSVFPPDSHKLYNPTSNTAHDGQEECPWICDVGYYRGGTNNDECQPCPNNASNCTTTGLGYQDVACTNPYTAVTHPDHTVTCESCTDSHAINDGGTCKCAVGYYWVPAGLDTECHQCPNFASTDDINSQSINDCHCRGDYGQYPAENPTVTGDFVCTKCDNNATVDSATKQCTCKANYYGYGLNSDGLTCEKCPAGTTKSAGGDEDHPTTQSACHFTSGATKFCVPSTTRTVDNSGYVCFTPTNVTYLY